jgi:hypothetical protein
MSKALLKDGTTKHFTITLQQFCDMFGLYRPYLRRGWDDTEYSDFKKAAATILNINVNDIESASL